jgi:lauroyl/myristoyl acyltransferase
MRRDQVGLALIWKLLAMLLILVPPRGAQQMGRLGGCIAWWLSPALRRRHRRAWSWRLSPRAIDATGRRAAAAGGEHLVFTLGLSHWHQAASVRIVDPWHGFDHLSRHGGVLATIHADWDVVLAVTAARISATCAAIARPEAAPAIDRLLARQRAAAGFSTLPWPPARQALRVLREGGVVGIVIDRPYGEALAAHALATHALDTHALASTAGRPCQAAVADGRRPPWRVPAGPMTLAARAGRSVVPVFARWGQDPLVVVGRPIAAADPQALSTLDTLMLRAITACADRWQPTPFVAD